MRLDLPPEIIESMKKLLNSNSSLTEPEFEPIRDILDDFLSSGYKDHEIQAEFRLSALEMTTLDSKMEEMEPGWKLKERNARHRFTGRLRAEALEDAPIAQRLSLLGMLDSDFSPKSNIDISVKSPAVERHAVQILLRENMRQSWIGDTHGRSESGRGYTETAQYCLC